MISRTSPRFRKMYRDLPEQVRQQARNAYRQFKDNPYHTSLHFKSLHTTKRVYSVRINNDYRAVGIWEGDTIV